MSEAPHIAEENVRKKCHAAYMRQKRKKWTEEEKERNRELSRLRMRKRRDKLKQEMIANTKSSPGNDRQTRQAKQKELERKQHHAEYKRKYRAQLSSQKKRRIREKDAAKKRMKRKEKTIPKQSIEPEPTKSSSRSSSLAAMQKMVYRAKKNLPKSPHRYAAIVKGLATCVTPKRKEALKNEGISSSPNAKRNLEQFMNIMKDVSQSLKGTSNQSRKRRREFVKHFAERLKEKSQQNQFCSATGIKRKYLNLCCSDQPRKRRKDAVSSEVQDSVQNFYEKEEVAIVIPDKKAVKKDLEQTQVMQMSLTTAWTKWKSENPDKQLSFDKFRKLRPKKIRTQKYRKLFQCLCEYCENIKLKLTSVNKLAARLGRGDLKILNEFNAVNETMCHKGEEKYNKLSCIDRGCKDCGTALLREKLRPLFEFENPDEIKWLKWETVKSINPKTRKEISKRQEVEKTGSPADLINELLTELEFLSVHLFEAQWQQQQFALLNKGLPDNSVSITIDFAENYTCFCQNEIQGAHWSKDSVTIHPCICIYKCPNDDELVEECVDIVSDDLRHDSHAVSVFLTQVIRHLKDTRRVQLQHAYVISDGCASQYKCRFTLMDVSCSSDDYQVTIERAYYGSRHGKNRCDGEAGVVKSKATRDVKNKVTNIYDARTFYNSVKSLEKPAESEQGVCLHKRRTLLFVSADEIQHERPERDCKTVPGTRKLHSVLGLERGVIKTRRLSCFCAECLKGNYDRCLNTNYVDKWKQVVLKPLLNEVHPAPEELEETDIDDTIVVPPAATVPHVLQVAEMPQLPADVPPAMPHIQQEIEVPQASDVLAANVPEILPALNNVDASDIEDHSLYDDLSCVDADVSFGDMSLGDGNVSLTTLLESLDSEPQYKEGDFVVVQLWSGKRSVDYVAEVKRLLPNSEVVLKYMEKTVIHGETFYRWPTNDDVSQESMDCIVEKMSDPILVEEKSTTRIQVFRFN